MSHDGAHTKRIAKNTMFLYFRMLFLICLQFYSVPIVLNGLGVENYGIYSVVGGIVTLFSFLTNSLASGSQRFLAYAIGKRDVGLLKKVFESTVLIYWIIGIVALLILDPVCVWFLNAKMTIAESSLPAANWVLQLSFVAFFVNLISVPYNAALIAHERMSIFAYVSILDGVLKLGAAISLKFYSGDGLVFYAVLILLINVLVRVVYQIYCRISFVECKKVHFALDRSVGRQLLAYLSWNIVGAAAGLLRNQGLNVVLNLFFGPALNAAHSIAQQVHGTLNQFINNLYLATRPRLAKCFASNEIEEMWNLTRISGKLAFFLLMLVVVPVLAESKFLLNLWLGSVPQYTEDILLLLIAGLLLETLVNPIIGVFQAQNKIKKYQLYSSSLLIMVLPISFFLLKNDSSFVLVPYIVSTIFSFFFVCSILYVAKKELEIDLKKTLVDGCLRELLTIVLVALPVMLVSKNFDEGLDRCAVTFAMTILMSLLCIWGIGLNRNERNLLKKIIQKG